MAITVKTTVTLPPEPSRFMEAAITRTIRLVSAFAQGIAKKGAPVDQGQLRNSIHLSEVRRTPRRDLVGGIETNVAHAVVMEDGRKPGKKAPPPDAIEAWVSRHRGSFGISQNEVKSVAFLVGRAIARRGIKGKKFFAKATKQTQKRLAGFMESMGIEIAREWNQGR